MKKILILLLLITGCASNPFKVGNCVRELGYEKIEKITYVTRGGVIETTYSNSWRPGEMRKQIYDNSNKLIPMECK